MYWGIKKLNLNTSHIVNITDTSISTSKFMSCMIHEETNTCATIRLMRCVIDSGTARQNVSYTSR